MCSFSPTLCAAASTRPGGARPPEGQPSGNCVPRAGSGVNGAPRVALPAIRIVPVVELCQKYAARRKLFILLY